MAGTLEEAVQAIVTGDAEGLRELLAAEPSLIEARSSPPHRSTLLHYVVANGIEQELQKTPLNAVEIAKILVDRGVDINAIRHDIQGNPCTGLHFTAWLDHADTAQVLIERGADINRKDPNIGAAPLGWARHNGNEAAAELLVAAGTT